MHWHLLILKRRIMEEFKKQHKYLWQFAEYLFSGGVYFIVGYIILDWLYYGLGWKHGAKFWWATIISSVIGWVTNYLMQRYWVFANSGLDKHRTQVTGRYAFITLLDFLINYLILAALKGIGITPAIGQFISAGFFTGWNYAWYRYWVFPTHRDEIKLHRAIGRLFLHRAHGHSAYIRHG